MHSAGDSFQQAWNPGTVQNILDSGSKEMLAIEGDKITHVNVSLMNLIYNNVTDSTDPSF